MVLYTLLISKPYCKYNIKFSKGRSVRCERKQKENKFDERNAGTWVRFLCFIYSLRKTKATACNIIINDTPTQVSSSQFCEIFKNILFTEHLRATAFKEMYIL